MKVLIVEDEPLAADKLKRMIKEVVPEATILAKIDSVESAVNWLKSQTDPDLIFMDIQLSDGLSFLIFEKVDVRAPVVFTTAFDEYAIKAFKVNSVDYLLKPIDQNDLEVAIEKFKKLNQSQDQTEGIKRAIASLLPEQLQSKLLFKIGDRLIPVEISDIAYFFAEEKIVLALDKSSKKYPLDSTLDDLARKLNKAQFFRINRKYFVNRDCIKTIKLHFNGRLKVELQPTIDEEIYISRERVGEFKDWLQF